MKKYYLTLFYLLGHICLLAQNYECLKPGLKQYFINSDNYLRGIRIDSVYTQWQGISHYYLFHTARGRYLPSNPPNDTLHPLDANGGSWVGQNATSYGNGNWEFYTYWGDTVFIKAKANVGDTWMFYNDTSTYYYTAEVTSADTATIFNVLDSIKTITLTAYHNASINPTDMVNDARIILSKNHGFLQTCELYMFPLHEPGVAYSHGFDLFLDNLSHTGPNAGNISFRQIDFHNSDNLELFNYNVGDVFEWTGDNSCLPYKRIDSIVARDTVSPLEMQYTINRQTWQFHTPPTAPTNISSVITLNIHAGLALIIDTIKMPEEWLTTKFYYYNPYDSSQCYPGTFYGLSDNFIYGDINGYYVNTFEPCGAGFQYKCGFGEIEDAECFDPTPCTSDHFDQMTYSYKTANPSGPCGTFSPIPNGIKEPNLREISSVSPNPANSYIITNNPKAPYTVTFVNMLGEIILRSQCNKTTESINTSLLPTGIYNLLLQQSDGFIRNYKILIVH